MMMMASAQVVETSVNTNNSPSQAYTTNPDDHSNHKNIIIIRDDMMLESLASYLREMARLRKSRGHVRHVCVSQFTCPVVSD